LGERIRNLKASILDNPLRRWLGFSVLDLVFLLLMVTALTFFLTTSIYHMKRLDDIGKDVTPLVAQMAQGMPPEAGINKAKAMEESVNEVMAKLVVTSASYFLIFSVLVSSWAFIGMSKIMKKRLRFKIWAKFILAGMVWAVLLMGILTLIIRIIGDLLVCVITSIIFLFISAYLTIIFFYSLCSNGMLQSMKDALIVGIKKIASVGLAFIVCIIVLLAFNIAFYLIKPSFDVITSIISVMFFVLFLTWCRFYLCAEIKGVLDG